MLALLAHKFDVELRPRRLKLPGGAYFAVDGVSSGETALVEAFARRGLSSCRPSRSSGSECPAGPPSTNDTSRHPAPVPAATADVLDHRVGHRYAPPVDLMQDVSMGEFQTKQRAPRHSSPISAGAALPPQESSTAGPQVS
jgi:hypothetical protein